MFQIEIEGFGSYSLDEEITLSDFLFKNLKDMSREAIAAEITAEGRDPFKADLSHKIIGPCKIKIISKGDEGALDILNHSSSHVMAEAIKRIFPDAKFAIGPSIKNGFYYDFESEKPVAPEDLKKIESEMKKIIASNEKFERKELSKEEARKVFNENPYKIELINAIEDDTVSLYTSGQFVDLCAGPHIPSTGRIGAFKLLSIAGAYWRGDEKNKMLQRIYGTAFYAKDALKAYLEKIERAKLSDHRKIGKDLDLYSFHDEAPGFPFWHPKGMIIRNLVIDYWRKVHIENGYEEILTPIILSGELWRTSGHWDHYKDNMYFVEIDECEFAVKPMNCPGAILVYKSKQHSYKEFPIRFAELGLVHRHEKSGVLHGLFRVRNFTQDDAHIFSLEENLGEEISKVINLIRSTYEIFGFKDYHLELSTRPEDRVGTDEMWDKAEFELEKAMKENNLEYKVNPGDGAFYGPKIDFHIKDSLDRTWQCATVQLDFAMPELFDITYMGEDNYKHRPVMLHRVVLGSVERFIGILIENYGGNLPLWIAPLQAAVLPISDKFLSYGKAVLERLKLEGFRVEIDERVESLNKKIRQAEMNKIPLMIIIGEKEEQNSTVTIRKKSGGDIKDIKIEELIDILNENVKNKKTNF